MKPTLKILFTILLGIVACSQALATVSKTAADADKAYAEQNYAEAVDLYNQALEKDGASADLYYNLGNAYYKSGNLAKAIINYERALKLDPTHSDARSNLEFVNTMTVDKQQNGSSYSISFIESIQHSMTANGWAITSLVLFVVTLIIVGVYFLANAELVRKIFFFSGLFMILVVSCSIVLTIMSANERESQDFAVITSEKAILSNSPSAPLTANDQAFQLHEGTKVQILDELPSGNSTWYKVSVNNEHQAWVNEKDIEII